MWLGAKAWVKSAGGETDPPAEPQSISNVCLCVRERRRVPFSPRRPLRPPGRAASARWRKWDILHKFLWLDALSKVAVRPISMFSHVVLPWRLAFGVWRLAFGGGRKGFGKCFKLIFIVSTGWWFLLFPLQLVTSTTSDLSLIKVLLQSNNLPTN